jgi:hypothetical protein
MSQPAAAAIPSVFCIANSYFQASEIVDRLREADIPFDGISTLLADQNAGRVFDPIREERATGPAIAAASTGAVIGATWGWIAGIGALAIPGAGWFIAAGPIIGAMSGATVGAVLGGIWGALITLGVPVIEAKKYEGHILKGGILISVHAQDDAEIQTAWGIFRQTGARNICCISQVAS